MDKLKNFIDTNREAFEDDLLPEGHFERFEQKLAVPRKSRATLYSLCAFAAAACIALLFLFKLPGGTPLPTQPRQDKLKNFIDTNREAFEDDLLPEGHFERFEQKLAVPRKSRATLYSLCAFAAAACIALLFLFKLPGGTPLPTQPRQVVTGQHACEVKEEIEELRLYYNMQMSDIISQMQAMYKLQQTPGAEELLKETKRVLTDNYMFEETVLPTLPCSNAGLYAMNLHYSTSLESLNIMLKQMENMEDFNRNSKQ